jgi:urea transport system ATP-binding protein
MSTASLTGDAAAADAEIPSKARESLDGMTLPPPGPLSAESTPSSAAHGSMVTASDKSLTALAIEHVTVSFDGFKALNDLTLSIERGELRCIIGPNGAGKSTLMDVVTGKTRPTSGVVYFAGGQHELTQLDDWEIARLGVGRKFQRPTVFQGHTVLDNLDLAVAGKKGVFRTLFSRRTRAESEKIDAVLERVGLTELRDQSAGLLSHGHKQWLEIGMLLMQDPKVMLVDEPVAGMNHAEMERTAELLTGLAGDHTVIVVEHDMDFIRSIARTVTVLHEGRVLCEGSMRDVQNDPKVVEVYLGS